MEQIWLAYVLMVNKFAIWGYGANVKVKFCLRLKYATTKMMIVMERLMKK